MNTVIHERVAHCRAGHYPPAICRVHSGWVVLGDVQILRGYALIYPDPVVAHFNCLDAQERKTLMYEASVVGDALLSHCGAVRINYEILGNLAPALHVHVFPRYDDEPEALRTQPVWLHDWDAAATFDARRDAPLMDAIREHCRATGIMLE